MLGLIKKDLLLIAKDKKLYLIILFLLLIMGASENPELSAPLLVFYIFYMYTSSFQYDRRSKFYGYASSFPSGRKSIVLSKYLGTIVIMVIFQVFLYMIYRTLFDKSNLELLNILRNVFIMCLIITGLNYPLYFKLSPDKARVFMIFLILLGTATISKLSKNEELMSKIAIFSHDKIWVVSIFVCLLFLISLLISLKIIKNKDF